VSKSIKAIILIAGVGKRLSDAKGDPKCLTKIDGIVLLERYFKALEKADIRDIVLVVGYKQEKIIEFTRQRDFKQNIKFIENPDFTRGSILSLNKAREELNNNVLLMDGDVYFEDDMLKALLSVKQENALAIDTTSRSTGEEMMVGVKNGRVMDMRRQLTGEYDTIGESVGFFRLNKQACKELKDIMTEKIKLDKYDLGYEDILPILFQKIYFKPIIIDGLKWVEIDFPEDIVRAEKLARGTR
jgi:choline kinase